MKTKIIARKANVTTYPADVIVNAARPSLLGGGGVDGAIHRAAGPDLLAECRTLGGAETGESKMTDAYGLTQAKKIVHTVGPVYHSFFGKKNTPEESARLLANCYISSLELAAEYESIAFPGISTGSYGYPLEEATHVALQTIIGWLESSEHNLQTVTLVAYNDKEIAVMSRLVDEYTND
jgi:O-acetyl-ADP-ribose deacetylase (regulator of RNase III)